jgi:hypothetical protein
VGEGDAAADPADDGLAARAAGARHDRGGHPVGRHRRGDGPEAVAGVVGGPLEHRGVDGAGEHAAHGDARVGARAVVQREREAPHGELAHRVGGHHRVRHQPEQRRQVDQDAVALRAEPGEGGA